MLRTVFSVAFALLLAAILPTTAAAEQASSVNRQEHADSGWAISLPPTLHHEVRRRLSVDHSITGDLRGTREPVISDRSQDRGVAGDVGLVPRRPVWQSPAEVGHTPATRIEASWVSSKLADIELGNSAVEPARGSRSGSRNADMLSPATEADTDVSIQFRRPTQQKMQSEAQSAAQDPRDLEVRRLADSLTEPSDVPSANDHPSDKVQTSPAKIARENAVEPFTQHGFATVPDPGKSAVPRPAASATSAPAVTAPTTNSTGQVSRPSQPPATTAASKGRIASAEEPKTNALARPLTKREQRLRNKLRRVLRTYYKRPLNSRDHDPWELMHGMLAYGLHSRVLQNGPQGAPMTAVGWLCYNRPCKGKILLYETSEGELRARWGVGVQGHYGQFLAMLAQCRVSANYPIRVGASEYSIQDLVEAEKRTCQSGEELTFKLIALMHYCRSDETWLNEQGSQWDIPRLIREELEQPIRGAPCGGTHRLSGLSLAAKTRVMRGEPLDGEYRRAREFVQKHHEYAFKLQNSDGSLSTNWFRGRGDEEDINRRIKTSGHILEWLIYSLDEERLRDWPTIRAVDYIANLLYTNQDHDWEIGPLCHAIHALVLYDERVYRKHEGLELAARATRSAGKSHPRRTSNRSGMRSRRR